MPVHDTIMFGKEFTICLECEFHTKCAFTIGGKCEGHTIHLWWAFTLPVWFEFDGFSRYNSYRVQNYQYKTNPLSEECVVFSSIVISGAFPFVCCRYQSCFVALLLDSYVE